MSNLTILRQYAAKAPASLPNSILFQHSSKFLTIFDKYPKSIFHFLVLPRILEGEDATAADFHYTTSELRNLRTLLRTDEERSRRLIEDMKQEAEDVKKQIQEEMMDRYGFKWDVWIGFHAVPSMEHLHLHVMSADLVSESMKNKKHYNSFHPSMGFFLHVTDVLEWFEATPDYFNQVTELNPKKYEDLLKEGLACFKCGSGMKNMPALKEHLQMEWDKQAARSKRAATKRKAVEDVVDLTEDAQDDKLTKKSKIDTIEA